MQAGPAGSDVHSALISQGYLGHTQQVSKQIGQQKSKQMNRISESKRMINRLRENKLDKHILERKQNKIG